MKILKRYYIYIFVIALVTGILITDISKSKFAVIKTSDVDSFSASASTKKSRQEVERVNINTASKRLLTTLDGIGEKMAERIIEYREESGEFETVEDIMKVSGIGYDKFLKLRDYITVE